MKPVEDIEPENLRLELEESQAYRRKLEHAAEDVGMMYADLDGHADGELPAAPTGHMREAQEHLTETRELLESRVGVVETRIQKIKQRIGAVEDPSGDEQE